MGIFGNKKKNSERKVQRSGVATSPNSNVAPVSNVDPQPNKIQMGVSKESTEVTMNTATRARSSSPQRPSTPTESQYKVELGDFVSRSQYKVELGDNSESAEVVNTFSTERDTSPVRPSSPSKTTSSAPASSPSKAEKSSPRASSPLRASAPATTNPSKKASTDAAAAKPQQEHSSSMFNLFNRIPSAKDDSLSGSKGGATTSKTVDNADACNDGAFAYLGGVMTAAPESFTVDSGEMADGETKAAEDETFHTNGGMKGMRNPEPEVIDTLIRWKRASENGPWLIRLALVLSALGMLVTSALQFILDPDSLTLRHGVLAAFTFVIAIFIVVTESRFSAKERHPSGLRAGLRRVILKHFGMLRYAWGRGLMAMFAGSLHIAKMSRYTVITGAIVFGLGCIQLFLGSISSYSLGNLKASLTDDSFVEYLFNKHDKDGDGYINSYEFGLFLVDMGLEFDDLETLDAFDSIRKQRKRKVSFDEFRRWWSQCKFDYKRKPFKA